MGRGTVPLLSNLRPFHDKLVERVQIPFFSLWFSIPIDPVKMWIEPFARLVFIALLISFIRFSSLLWQVDQMNVNLVFLSFVLKLLYGCTHLDHSISVVLAVTTAPLRTLEMS